MKKKIYTRDDLIARTLKLLNAGRNDFSSIQRQEVNQILSAYEAVILDCLKETSSDNPEVEIKPLHGMSIAATYKPDRQITMYGKIQKAKSKISAKAKLSKYFGYAVLNEN